MQRPSQPPPKYDPADEAAFRAAVFGAVQALYARGESIEMWPGASVIIRSPDGARWKIAVSNAGALSAVAA